MEDRVGGLKQLMVEKVAAFCCRHRRRINTEEKAKVVAAVWGTEFIQFLAALAILHYRTILENRMNSSFCLIHLGACNSSYSSSRPSAKQLAGQGQGIL